MILVDSHVAVWLAFDQNQLPKGARAAIDAARQNGDGLAICDITLLELATLVNKGRVRLDISFESFLRFGSSSYRSVAVRVRASWGSQQPTPRIQRIELLEPRHRSKGQFQLLLTVRSFAAKWFTRSGVRS